MVTESKRRVPILPGAWTRPASTKEKQQLIGSECPYCGEIFFPRRTKSYCVHCQKDGLKDKKLSRKGKIKTFTVVMQQPGGGYYHGPVPYAMGIVELPEGVYVETLLKTEKFSDLSVGMSVELVIEKIWEDDNTELIGYKFQPVR
jgi:uncharacterized OB-fold protein